jgi:hypothetical protein
VNGVAIYVDFDLGFDEEETLSSAPRRICGLRREGPAARAGLRYGDELVALEEPSGKKEESVSYTPAGATAPGQSWTHREIPPMRRRALMSSPPLPPRTPTAPRERRNARRESTKGKRPGTCAIAQRLRAFLGINPGGVLLSHNASIAVPSAPKSLTSEFGMGSGVASSKSPPEILGRSRGRAFRCSFLPRVFICFSRAHPKVN